MDEPHLIYFADPMCSWCYGFSPVIEDIRRTVAAPGPSFGARGWLVVAAE